MHFVLSFQLQGLQCVAKEGQAYWALIKLATPMKLMVVIQICESLCAYWHSCYLDYVNTACRYDWHCRCKNIKLSTAWRTSQKA